MVSSARRVLRAWKVWEGGAVSVTSILGGFREVNLIVTVLLYGKLLGGVPPVSLSLGVERLRLGRSI